MVIAVSETHELPSLLTAPQIAELLQLSTRTVWRLRSAGKLPNPVEIGGSVRWNRDEIQRWITAGCPDQSRSKR